jgi:LPS export ABC transporter protein LptC
MNRSARGGLIVPGLWLGLGIALVAACTDAGVRPTATVALADSADQVLFKMSTTITENGVRRSFVEAETAYVYQNRNVTELRHLTLKFQDQQGNLQSTLTADRGLYGTYSKSLDARGHVVVVTTDGRKLTTEHVVYDKLANQIRGDTAFVVDSPKGHLAGNGFLSDVDMKNVTVQQPKGYQKGKGTLLPGQ